MQLRQPLQYNRIYQKLVNPLTNERLIINASYNENKLFPMFLMDYGGLPYTILNFLMGN